MPKRQRRERDNQTINLIMDAATETQEKRLDISFSSKNKTPEVVSVKDAESVVLNIIKDLPHKNTGQVTEKYISYIKEKRDQYKTLRSFYACERAGKRIPKKKEDDLKKVGLTTKGVSENTAILSSRLYDSLYSTYRLIYITDPQKEIDSSEPKKREYINLGVKVNLVFTDLFIDLHNRYGASDKQLDSLFETIFEQSSLGEDLNSRGLGGVRVGILATIKGYLYLAKQKPNWKVETPELFLDRDHGIDLVATSKNSNEINYYQIKRIRGDKVQLQNVTSDSKMEDLRNKLVLSPKKSSRRDLRSLANIFDYARNLRTQGKNVNAFWMQVPI